LFYWCYLQLINFMFWYQLPFGNFPVWVPITLLFFAPITSWKHFCFCIDYSWWTFLFFVPITVEKHSCFSTDNSRETLLFRYLSQWRNIPVIVPITVGKPSCFGGERTEAAAHDAENLLGVWRGGVVRPGGRMAALLPPDLLAGKARVHATQFQRLRENRAPWHLRKSFLIIFFSFWNRLANPLRKGNPFFC